jgi:hypothetical protein
MKISRFSVVAGFFVVLFAWTTCFCHQRRLLRPAGSRVRLGRNTGRSIAAGDSGVSFQLRYSETVEITLPWAFRFYGITYNQLSAGQG